MKQTTLLAMGLSACIAFTATALTAQEKKQEKPSAPKGGDGHSHFTKIPATEDEIWKAIHKQQVKLTDRVAKKDLGEAHDHAFAIRDLVKALPDKVPADSKAKAEEGAKEITKLAADIDKSAAAGAQKATEENVKRLGMAIVGLNARLKPAGVKK